VVYHHSSQQFPRFKADTISINLPAKTGRDNNNNTAHPNKASLCNLIPGVLIFIIVVMKLIAPSRELTPDRCKANIAKSTLGPL
jgi:hypothetical protein